MDGARPTGGLPRRSWGSDRSGARSAWPPPAGLHFPNVVGGCPYHLDLWVGAENVDAELERLTSRGAKILHRGQQGPHSRVTVADPEGNEFCIS
nr:VOC family protein [Planosporangium flavigriseum]